MESTPEPAAGSTSSTGNSTGNSASATSGGPASSNPASTGPESIQWQPVSPKYLQVRYISWAVGALIWAAIGVLPLLLRASGPWRNFPLWLAVGIAIVAALFILIPAVLIPRQVRAIGYAERNEDLLVKSGVIFQRTVVVPYGRMQFVDVEVGPLMRAFGLATLKLHTASSATNASIPGLPTAEAERLREQLSARGEALLAGI